MLEGNKAGKEMFDKGELAAILRFGAANLFEEEKDAKVKEEVTERDQALYNESIDAILARAEVVDQRVQVRSRVYSGVLNLTGRNAAAVAAVPVALGGRSQREYGWGAGGGG